MNYASMMVVFTVLAGAVSGGMVAAAEKARMVAVVLSSLGGLLFGFGLGGASYKLAWSSLRSKKSSSGVRLLVFYMALPLLSFLVVVFGTAWLVMHILHRSS